ncbi:hypothetical protein D3C80_1162340 [compost metagenome]
MAGETVGHADNAVFFRRQCLDFVGFPAGEKQRFFANHVQPGQQCRTGNLVMGAIRRGHRHHFYAVFSPGLLSKQRAVIVIAAIGIHPQIDAEFAAALRHNIKCPSHQRKGGIIPQCTATVFITHLPQPPAADHCPTQRPWRFSFTIQHSCSRSSKFLIFPPRCTRVQI